MAADHGGASGGKSSNPQVDKNRGPDFRVSNPQVDKNKDADFEVNEKKGSKDKGDGLSAIEISSPNGYYGSLANVKAEGSVKVSGGAGGGSIRIGN